MLEIDITGNVQVMLSMAEITADGSFKYLTEKEGNNFNDIINASITMYNLGQKGPLLCCFTL